MTLDDMTLITDQGMSKASRGLCFSVPLIGQLMLQQAMLLGWKNGEVVTFICASRSIGGSVTVTATLGPSFSSFNQNLVTPPRRGL